MLKDKLTLLIHTCEKYSDLWEPHIILLNRNWADRCLHTILATDEPSHRSFIGVDIVSAGKNKELSERTVATLDCIKTEYVLVTLDDYFLTKKIYSNNIQDLIDVMDNERLDYIRLFSDPNSFRRIKAYNNIYQINLNGNYKVNLYPGIWRKSFLEKTIGEPLNAWQYEVSLTKIAREVNARCAMSKGKEFEILDVVRKGKLLHKANRYLKKHKLYSGPREVISYKEELRLFVFSTGKKILPKGIARYVKHILAKKGIMFFSDIDS